MKKSSPDDPKEREKHHVPPFSGCKNAFEPGAPCCTILRSVSEGVFTIDLEKRVTFVNRAAESITGFSGEEVVGQYCFDIFRSSVCQAGCPLESAIRSGEPVYDQPAVIINKAGVQVAINLTADLLRSDAGDVLGAVEVFKDVSAIETLRKTITRRYHLGEMISKNHRMQDIFEILPDVAESESTVLIQGPSGSGKEVLANTIHELSPKKGKPFIKVNCGAIPDTLLESELFGYVKGAFTDAKKDKKGRFSLADHGSIFLDEVGDTSPAMQVKLLRVLEEKEFIPLGGTEPVRIDVRIIAASNSDLEKLVQEGKFREDLYYRINVIKIDLPPLCQKVEDIPLLTEHFLSKLNSLKGKNILGVSDEVMGLLMNYRFPGNVRELENILEHAYVLCRGQLIEAKHLPLEFLREAGKSAQTNQIIKPRESSEINSIEQALRKHGGNKVLVARELGIGRSTLWRKMKRFGLA
mgnify:CR=1 FL=1